MQCTFIPDYRVLNCRFTTLSSHFSAIYINIFHKTEIQTVILRCRSGSRIMTQNANISVSGIYRFCKKKTVKIFLVAIEFLRITMDRDGKKTLIIAILEFYKLNLKLWLDQLKIIGASSKWKFMKETRCIKMKQKGIDQDIVIEMFDHLKESSCRKSKWTTDIQNLLKFWILKWIV